VGGPALEGEADVDGGTLFAENETGAKRGSDVTVFPRGED